MSKSPKTTTTFSKNSRKSALILLQVLMVAKHESGTRNFFLSFSVTINNKNVSSHCNLTAQVEPEQDKLYYLTPAY